MTPLSAAYYLRWVLTRPRAWWREALEEDLLGLDHLPSDEEVSVLVRRARALERASQKDLAAAAARGLIRRLRRRLHVHSHRA